MDTKPWNDPIVEEVRAARESLFREAGCDLNVLHDRIKEDQKRHGNNLVKMLKRSGRKQPAQMP